VNTLRLFEKPTVITIQAGAGKHISARSLFTHLRDALEGRTITGYTTITISGEGSVSLDGETVYRPRRMVQNASKDSAKG
jgi:hypothetical protein